MSVGVSALFGFFLLVAYLFCIQDFQATLNNPYGQPVLQIMIDCVGTTGAKALMVRRRCPVLVEIAMVLFMAAVAAALLC